MSDSPAMPPEVAAVFARYPADARRRLEALRELIFTTAANTPGVGALEETLKWGQPSYLTSETKAGTTIRLGRQDARPDKVMMFVHCQTSLIDTLRADLPDDVEFEGKRAVVFDADDGLPEAVAKHAIEAALTYHLRKR